MRANHQSEHPVSLSGVQPYEMLAVLIRGGKVERGCTVGGTDQLESEK